MNEAMEYELQVEIQSAYDYITEAYSGTDLTSKLPMGECNESCGEFED